MKPEEELLQLRRENQVLRKQIKQRDQQLAHRLQALEERLAKDSGTASFDGG